MLHRLENKIDKINTNFDIILEYTQELKEEGERFEEAMKMKTELIAKLEQELAILNRDVEIKLKKKM